MNSPDRIRDEDAELGIELRCNDCHAIFPEADAVDDEFCPECGCDSLFERTSTHTNEYGETIAHAITTYPRDVEPVTQGILNGFQALWS